MSILSGSNNSGNMGAPFFHEFKKQASFFFKEKIKTARLALTDVTPAQLLTEEATNGNPWFPETRILKIISKAAFEVDDYWRIVEILHKRLAKFDKKNWRSSYNALIVLEHLLTHGPESVSEEFQTDRDAISEIGSFQHIDEKGFNWGLNVKNKTERISKLLERGPLLREERDRARKLTRGIEGFGSFCHRTSSESNSVTYGRCNSQFNNHGNEEDQFLSSENEDLNKKMENSESWNCSGDAQMVENSGARASFKENLAPKMELKPLLDGEKDDHQRVGVCGEDNHPFNDTQIQAAVSLLSNTDQKQLLQAC
ncbi:hypothetical protein HYC85_031746 [Camellia sinensis]|uniref:ENTH domain-containing protein n=1 Tax=Camellia sinensis TaxID=4442 RepID=A0A7J7FRB8_CAMSI|nr:hypothetical protein HYC85_031746 [Camellia sinensis]